jgi:RNA polymerase sigma factor (sigma-70 family)
MPVLAPLSRPDFLKNRTVYADSPSPTDRDGLDTAFRRTYGGYSAVNAFLIDEKSFAELMRAVRAGDEDAARELVRHYEPAIRKAVRTPLRRYRLNRFLDAADISQIVLASFFHQVVAGRFELHAPGQVLKLLLTMARTQLTNEIRRYMAGRRDSRRLDESFSEHSLYNLVDRSPSPAVSVAINELIEEVYRRFAPAESYIAEQRFLGRSWVDLAAEVGGSPEAVRKKFERAVERITLAFRINSR